jgi:hypothetical protein
MTLFKIDKKYFFINTTLEMLHSEGWQYVGLSGRYSGKDSEISATHENQFLIFFHMAEKIKMRQVEEEYWKFTDTSGVGNATNQKPPFVSPTPNVKQGKITSLPDEQKNEIERWVGDMNSNILGLQPRSRIVSSNVDGKRGPSVISENSRIQESTTKIPMPMPRILPTTPTTRETNVSISPTVENTIVQIMPDEPGIWL